MGKGVFFTSASMVLAVIITATLRSHHHHHYVSHPNNSSSFTDLASNASQLLRSNGFNFIATFLHITPELFLSTPQSTVFAIPDAAITNLSIPPYMTKQLLAYHISPSKLTIQDLFKKPTKTCLPTLISQQRIMITKNDYKNRVLEINNMLITHPDLFLQGTVAIHGVAGSFASFDHHQENIKLPVCESDHSGGPSSTGSLIKNKDEWGKVVKFLSSSGFMPFAIGLNSVTDGILKDFPDLKSVTIFTPPNIALMAMPSPLLDKFMRFHIVPQRHSFRQLAGFPAGSSLGTLVKGKHVDITETSKLSQIVSINGVAITAPDVFVSKNFIVHGIARPLSMDELSSMSR
ncbi:fasciclin-like arabinogalactan protein 21 [Cynara cardunculus var. scolymus]|uniref:FAS1 domain-containing protein n=1 Tax=Cynara cardunculus var. scolymus TaxID=59895 RepID=A0A103Y7Z2_CYNCS|nr:fasciclin-like arabinogalactan protein 21 [Cynara cardunculus var. scolymus]KVI04192.1 FAS1 domain-containing protein [Cynara cardunculus var. scolymus]